jgi:HAD superfamily hydrolase (TIGR01509 family)
MPGAIELVRAASGIRPLAVASNAPASIVRSYLAPFGILDAFDVIVGSTDVRSPKPAPDVYLLACERLRVRPARAVAVEDSPVGVASARAAQLRVVGIPSARDLRLRAHAVYDSLDDPNVWHELGVPRPVTVEST